MCLYTDGLVERRGRSLTVGLDRLAEAMFAGPPESVCATVMQALVGAEPPSDDIALLVLRRQPGADTDTDTLELELPAAPSSLKPLRIAMRRWLAHIRADRQATADLLTAVGEACANAVEHAYGAAGGTVSVSLAYQAPDVIAVVGDTGRWRAARGELPRPRHHPHACPQRRGHDRPHRHRHPGTDPPDDHGRGAAVTDASMTVGHDSADTARIALFGEIDMANADEVEQQILGAIGNQLTAVTIDLSGLEYIDSAGLRVLFTLGSRLESCRSRSGSSCRRDRRSAG